MEWGRLCEEGALFYFHFGVYNYICATNKTYVAPKWRLPGKYRSSSGRTGITVPSVHLGPGGCPARLCFSYHTRRKNERASPHVRSSQRMCDCTAHRLPLRLYQD